MSSLLHGAQFWFEVPFTPAKPTSPERSNSGSLRLAGRGAHAQAREGRSSGSDEEAECGNSVLVIDDDEMIREICETMLLTSGFSVYTAENGERGLALMKQRPYLAVLTDIQMPVRQPRPRSPSCAPVWLSRRRRCGSLSRALARQLCRARRPQVMDGQGWLRLRLRLSRVGE